MLKQLIKCSFLSLFLTTPMGLLGCGLGGGASEEEAAKADAEDPATKRIPEPPAGEKPTMGPGMGTADQEAVQSIGGADAPPP